MRALIARVCEAFNGGRSIIRVEQQIVKIRNGNVSADVAENFESDLDRNLRFNRKEGILTSPACKGSRGVHNDLGIRGSGNVAVSGNVDGVSGSPKLIFS